MQHNFVWSLSEILNERIAGGWLLSNKDKSRPEICLGKDKITKACSFNSRASCMLVYGGVDRVLILYVTGRKMPHKIHLYKNGHQIYLRITDCI